MKRLISAAIIAVGIHSLLMSMDVDWMNLTGFKKPSTGSVTIIIESIQPQKTTPKNEPLPPKQFPRKVEKNVVETAPKTEPPLPPIVQKKPVRAIKKPEKKPPIVKSAPAKQDRPAEPKKPAVSDQAPPPSPESVPDETSQGNDSTGAAATGRDHRIRFWLGSGGSGPTGSAACSRGGATRIQQESPDILSQKSPEKRL